MKKFKRVIASVGLFAVMLVFFCVTCLADDIVIPSSNIEPITDMYQMKQMVISGYDPERGEGYELTSTIGSPFQMFINTKMTPNTSFDSRDMISLYVGNETENRWRDIELIHEGNSYGEYFGVTTSFNIPMMNALADDYIVYYYDDLVYNMENFIPDMLFVSKIPYTDFRNLDNGITVNDTVNVKYSFTIYEETNTDTGTKISPREIEYTEVIDVNASFTQIYMLPTSYFLSVYGEVDNIYISNLKVEIPTKDIYERFELRIENTFIPDENLEDYSKTIADWINANVPKIDRYLEVDVAPFLITAVSGFMAFELYPGLSLMGIVAFLVAIPLLMLILKVFKD